MKTRKTFLTAGAIIAFSLSLGFGQSDQNREVGATETYTEEQTTIRQQPLEQEQESLSPQGRMQQQDRVLQQQEQQEFGAPPESRQTQTQTQAQSQKQTHKISDLKGSEVQSSGGERIGTVDDLAVNLQTGEASYLIVSAGGFLGIGGELRPVPLQAVQFNEQDGKVQAVVNITDQQWENAPTVKREEVAKLSEESQAREIYQFYGEDYQQIQQQQRQFGAPQRSGQSQDETIDQLLQQHRERQQQQPSSSSSQSQDQSSSSGQQSATTQSSQQEFGSPNRDSSSSSNQSPSSGQQSESSAIQSSNNQPESQEFGATTQRQSSSAQSSQTQQSQSQGEFRMASDLVDKEVTNTQQQKLGKISDLLIDTEQGRISFVLLKPDTAFWQASDDTFAVAPQSFQTVSDQQAILNITQQDLEQAQMLNESNIQQFVQQAASSSSGPKRVYRYQEPGDSGSRGVFGSPDRERESTSDPSNSDSLPNN